MKKILFVCTGNASRSAAAKVVLKKMLTERGIKGVKVASCGTGVPKGLLREKVMCDIAAEYGYQMGGKAIPMTPELLAWADVIIVMTERHRREVKYMLRRDKEKCVVRFNEYCFGEAMDLPDPHYQSEYVYRKCFEIIDRGCREIVMGNKSFAFELDSFAMRQSDEDIMIRF